MDPDLDDSDKLDPDPEQLADDQPECMKHKPIWALFQGFEPLFIRDTGYDEYK